jgi:uncharacterized protein YbbK (DUF523 family)
MSHLPSVASINALPFFTPTKPIRILVSSCLLGTPCGVEGTSYGDFLWIKKILSLPNVRALTFCPEDFAFGTPRAIPDIHGGNGFAVLEGKARVLTDKGEDWTNGMITAAQTMLKLSLDNSIDLAILMDMSAACGSQVISDGCRRVEHRRYQKGPGVAAALLMRHGIWVVSQRDFRTLERLHHKLNPDHSMDSTAKDHHETDWYRSYFKD